MSELPLFLRKNVWALAAFIVPLAIRCVPEVLAWPYPLGFDTLTYIMVIDSNQVFASGPFGFLTYHLFYSLATLVNWLIDNPVVVIDVFGPLLMGLVSFMMYLYALRGLGWSGFKSFVVALLVGTYFVSLRNSWDLYSQSLGLIFLLAALLVLGSASSPRRYVYAFVFVILTFLSHELTAIILVFVLGLEAFRFLLKRRRNDLVYLIVTISLAGVLFLFTHPSSQGDLATPLVSNASAASVALASYIGGFLIYCYIFVLPLVILGFAFLKDWVLKYWTILCAGIPLVAMIFPTLPLYDYDRWVLLLVYPLLFFAVHGLDKLWHFWSRHKSKIKCMIPKILAITYVVFLLVMSGYYLIGNPNNQIAYFSKDNRYLAFIQSGMFQNDLPISDNPSLLKCFEWINNNNEDSAVLMNNQLCYYAVIYLKSPVILLQDPKVTPNFSNKTILGQQMVEDARTALAEGHNMVYTVWWSKGEGWYDSFALPSEFKVVYGSGEMAVYLFNQTAQS